MTRWQSVEFRWRVVCFLACIPSGGALLAKVYGVASLQNVVVYLFLPGCVLLVWGVRSGRVELSNALILGFWGGLLGTFAYDLIRVPFLLFGSRIFAPINVYGVWLAEAEASSQLTHALGWMYHFSNGVTFGMMYALFMRKRHWFWAIIWGLVLESIALASPFREIFNLSSNYQAIGIAYLGHVAYGLPLGWIVYKWDEVSGWLESRPGWLRHSWVIVGMVTFLAILLWPSGVARDNRLIEGTLQVEGHRLNPGWLRVERGTTVPILNSESLPVTVVNRTLDEMIDVPAGGENQAGFSEPAIYQIYVQTDGQTRSSFVIVEPVEDSVP